MAPEIHPQAEVHPTAVLGKRVRVGAGTRVGAHAVIEDDVVLGERNVIWPTAFVGRYTTLGDENQVHPGAVIGHLPQDLSFDPSWVSFTRIGHRNTFREHSQVHRGSREGAETVIGDDNLFMALTHVAHDCVVGNRVVLVNQASLPGHCQVADRVLMSGFTGIHQFCRIGRLAMISALSVSNKDLPPFFVYGGRPALAEGVNRVGLRRAGVSREARAEIKTAYRLLYASGLTIPEALERMEAELRSPEVAELVDFVRKSKRGIAFGSKAAADTLSTKRHRAEVRLPRPSGGDGRAPRAP
ncbi:MAG: acyl-ACP--UDP-N-acetylglucosamine O-acyltransferase [Planctomycetota bacterium]|nr:MAG: acyl-ACP--UDP-N-acetylglucosamine O-acyltransferase [Planctomycetota bacterium]